MCCFIDLAKDFDLLCRDLLFKPIKKNELSVNSLKWSSVILLLPLLSLFMS
jgi:hypothetical protein